MVDCLSPLFIVAQPWQCFDNNPPKLTAVQVTPINQSKWSVNKVWRLSMSWQCVLEHWRCGWYSWQLILDCLKSGVMGWLCWGLTSQSTIFQSCRDGAIASWVINQYFRGVKCLAQGHNTATVGLEPWISRSGVRHSTTEQPRSPGGHG